MEQSRDWRPLRKAERVSADHDWGPSAKVAGASILPFMVDEHHKLVFFLLGRECTVQSWAAGSDRLSDFGGGLLSSKDKSPEETAAREFVEETLGVVKYFLRDKVKRRARSDFRDIALSLKRGEYLRKIETAYTTNEGDIRVFVTFVTPIPWDPSCIRRFQECRNLLTATRSLLTHHPRPLPSSLTKHEKEAMFPRDRAKKRFRHEWIRDHAAIITSKPQTPSCAPSWRSHSSPHISVGASSAPSWRDTTPDKKPSAFWHARQSLPVILGVRECYLEKTQLQLWSVPKLAQALRHEGRMVSHSSQIESMRGTFLPVLQAVLDDLTAQMPHHFYKSPHLAVVAGAVGKGKGR